MATMNMIQALNSAHRVTMERDPDVVVYGEDAGYFGGVFRVTEGLQQRYGEQRVFDAPIAEGGQVGIRVREQDGTCQVEVTDSGIGIPAADRTHLFERFYRASTATGTAGSGLGLAISKAIAEAHGGTIRIADSSGSGTRVLVEIPLHVAVQVTG